MAATVVSHRGSERNTFHPGNMWDNYLTAGYLANQENQLSREPPNSKLLIVINFAHSNYFSSTTPWVLSSAGSNTGETRSPSKRVPHSHPPCCVSNACWWRAAALRMERSRCAASTLQRRLSEFTGALLSVVAAAAGWTLAGPRPE